ncbi:protein of unknown function [Oribacterium sp. KHPX15]|uniref:DUF4250 domain-containing protein n=1 Tax=Oribacterium sp. KHPX15 TaxID=1855342 RepID=UPI0008971994|nr:DUF4250 domain-containing protein [Oribacterium sp. KHPX15]SEA34929.1 protein of unknown function [Oribacterium sp. KHPX15]
MAIPKDPVMLLSFINTQLRDNYDSLESLCKAFDVDQDSIVKSLAVIDYHYNNEINQFK